MKRTRSFWTSKNTLLSPLFRSPHKLVVGRGGLFFSPSHGAGAVGPFHDHFLLGAVHWEKSLMPNLLMHQANAYVPRFKVENTPTPPQHNRGDQFHTLDCLKQSKQISKTKASLLRANPMALLIITTATLDYWKFDPPTKPRTIEASSE